MQEKKIKCKLFKDGKPTCSGAEAEEKCPILHPSKYIDIKPGTLVIHEFHNRTEVGIVTDDEPSFPEEVYIKAKSYDFLEDSKVVMQKEDLIILIELPKELSKALSPEEALSMFAPKILLEQAKKLHELSNKVDELQKALKAQH